MNVEQRIAAVERTMRRPGRFHELCQELLLSPNGQELLSILCAVANPVDQTFCADPRHAAHLAGNRELVAALWKHGACTNSVPEPKPTEPN